MIGAGRHTGVTHLTISLANLLCSVRGVRVAVLEWNSHQDFSRMEKVCTGKVGKTKPFSVLGVDYYKEAGSREWELCMLGSYDYVVVDYGEAGEAVLYEIGRCDKKIMLGALTEWQQDACLACLDEEQKLKRGLTFAVVFGSKAIRAEAEKKYHVILHAVPLSVDAFAVTWEVMNELKVLTI